MAQIYIHPEAQKLHLVAALQRRTGLVAMPDGPVVRMIPADEWLAIRLAYRSARRNGVAEHFGIRRTAHVSLVDTDHPGPGAA